MNVADHAIITTIHNQSARLLQLLACLVAQTLKPAQWIIVDNGSDPVEQQQLQIDLHTCQAALPGVAIELIRQHPHASLAHARNAALARVQCERFSLLDPDSSYRPAFLERMQTVAKKYLPDMVILGYALPGLLAPEPRQATIQKLATPLEPGLYLLRDPLSLIGVSDFPIRLGANICYRTAFLQNLRYDDSLDCFEEIDLWYRTLRGGMARGPCRCMVESGDFLHLARRPDTIAAGPAANWRRPPPPLLNALTGSMDRYDQRMGNLLLRRWLPGMLQRIPGFARKLLFLWRHRRILPRFLALRRAQAEPQDKQPS